MGAAFDLLAAIAACFPAPDAPAAKDVAALQARGAQALAAISALDKPGLEGCYCHPKTPWLGRSAFTGSTDHYDG
mgnify:CR=1 FL=1